VKTGNIYGIVITFPYELISGNILV